MMTKNIILHVRPRHPYYRTILEDFRREKVGFSNQKEKKMNHWASL